MIAHPCCVCKKSVNENHKAIKCDICQLWVHIKCNKLDKNDYAYYQDIKNKNKDFFVLIASQITYRFPNLMTMNSISQLKRVH